MAADANTWRTLAKELLQLVDKNDLTSLATTASAGRLAFATDSEAIEAIIAHCKNATELLSRKKLKRDYLMRYLWEQNRMLKSNASKSELVFDVLKLWNCASSSTNSSPIIELMEDDDDSQIVQSTSSFSPASPVENVAPSTSTNDVILAGWFLRWFYDLLMVRRQDFGPQHFFDNATMKMNCGVEPNVVVQEYFNSVDIASCIIRLAIDERLIFYANLEPTGGFETLRESHGALMIKNVGVVHRDACCIGPFDIFFMVLQDPYNQQLWKIHRIVLTIRAPVNQKMIQ